MVGSRMFSTFNLLQQRRPPAITTTGNVWGMVRGEGVACCCMRLQLNRNFRFIPGGRIPLNRLSLPRLRNGICSFPLFSSRLLPSQSYPILWPDPSIQFAGLHRIRHCPRLLLVPRVWNTVMARVLCGHNNNNNNVSTKNFPRALNQIILAPSIHWEHMFSKNVSHQFKGKHCWVIFVD